MPRPGARSITLADVMILVAATGLGLACYVLVDNALFSGQRYLFGLFERPQGGWSSTAVMNRAAGVVSTLLMVFGGWTLALPVLQLRKAGPGWRRGRRLPGVVACLAAIVGMVFLAGVGGIVVLLRWWVDNGASAPRNYWLYTPALDAVVIYGGLAVLAAWAMLAITGRWRRAADWVDRLGRLVGILWVAAALVFSVRLVMG